MRTAQRSRASSRVVQAAISFLLNGFAFILIGLQLPEVASGLDAFTPTTLALYGALVSLTVVLVRLVWVFPATYLPRLLSRSLRARDPYPSWRSVSVIAWGGMRGVISLAAALSLPLTIADGSPLPGRDLILFLTFCVILTTLVVQGLTLPFLIRSLGLRDDGAAEEEEVRARVVAAEAALGQLDELESEDWVRPETARRVRELHVLRRDRFQSRKQDDGGKAVRKQEARSGAHQKLVRELAQAQRNALTGLRDEGHISDEVLRRVERDLDLKEERLDT